MDYNLLLLVFVLKLKYPKFGQRESIQAGFGPYRSLSISLLFGKIRYSSSFCTFYAPDLEPAISPGSSDSF